MYVTTIIVIMRKSGGSVGYFLRSVFNLPVTRALNVLHIACTVQI